MFVSESDVDSLEKTKMCAIGLRVTEKDGMQHVWLEGCSWTDVVVALLNAEVIVISVNAPEKADS